MGLVRFLLAVSVVGAHTVGFVFVGGKNAVLIFYMISGYLISHILNENPSYLNYKRFYLNRYLRIWPLYAITVLITLAVAIVAIYIESQTNSSNSAHLLTGLRETIPNISVLQSTVIIISNIFLVGIDISSFINFDGYNLLFGTQATSGGIPGSSLLIVPQAWTLGVELTFYLIAPFILRSKKIILTALSLFGAFAFLAWLQGISRDNPWDYKFSLFTMYLFLLGAFSQRFVSPRIAALTSMNKIWLKISLPISLLAVTLFQYIPETFRLSADILLQILFVFTLPVLFEFSKKSRVDRALGELSFPIYITHILVISVLFDLEEYIFGGTNSQLTFITTLIVTSATGYILNKTILKRIEETRGRIRTNDHILK